MLALWTSISGCDRENPVAQMPTQTASYADDVQALFDKRCVRCHRSSAPQHGFLNLKADSSYYQLVSQQSGQRPDLLLVDPFAPDASYLLWKVENDPRIEGNRMPMFALPMLEEEIQPVRTWISEGAFPQ